jgi:ferredoxin
MSRTPGARGGRARSREVLAMKIVVDFDLCQSHALCTEAAPELFEIRDDGFLYVLNETPGPELAGKAEKAALECPTGAITIEDS